MVDVRDFLTGKAVGVMFYATFRCTLILCYLRSWGLLDSARTRGAIQQQINEAGIVSLYCFF